MTISREQMLHEMGLSPQWKLRDNPAVSRAAPASMAEASPAAPPTEARAAPAPMPSAEPASVRGIPGTEPPAQLDGPDWKTLQQNVENCRACTLCAARQRVVLGVGDPGADWLFVGEAPGLEEDACGEPFVGPAGKLLDAMLAAIDLKRGDGVYLTNAVKCHPADNRTPETAELQACAPYLRQQIALLQPRLIVLLGRAAVHALLGAEGLLGSLRGQTFEYRNGEQTIPVIATYHPAYLLRTLPDKAKAWEDLCRARALMREIKAAGLENAANGAI